MRKTYLRPAINRNLIETTDLSEPASRNQRYRRRWTMPSDQGRHLPGLRAVRPVRIIQTSISLSEAYSGSRPDGGLTAVLVRSVLRHQSNRVHLSDASSHKGNNAQGESEKQHTQNCNKAGRYIEAAAHGSKATHKQ